MASLAPPFLIALTTLGAAAQPPAVQPPSAQMRPQDPEDAPPPREQGPCDTTGCPRQDASGEAPTRCELKSGISTGFRCILICTYPASSWGTVVDGSRCK